MKYENGYWEENKEEIIDMYVNKHMNSSDIAKLHGCWGSTIMTYLHKWGIPVRNPKSGEQYNNIYECNVKYFDIIDTEDKAYWLGYILADGHISSKHTLMLGCSYVDVDILEKFKKCINSSHKIFNNKDGNTCLSIGSKHLCETLNSYGLNNNKTFDMEISVVESYVPKEYKRDFIRGMFDGDGSIRFYNYPYAKGFQYHLGYTGLKSTCEYFAEYLNIHTKLISEGNSIFTCRTANAPLIKHIYYVLYDNANIYCDRKYRTYQNILRLIHKEGKDKVKGVCYYKWTDSWVATCRHNKSMNNLGYFKTKEEAEYARLKFEYETYGYDAPQWYYFEEYGIGETA